EELDLSEAQQALDVLNEEIEKIDAQLTPLNEERQRLQEALSELEDDVGREQRKAHDLETQFTQMKVALSQRENELEGLVERIRADLGLVSLDFDEEQGGQTPLPMSELVESLPEVTDLPGDIDLTIQDYRGQLHRIGSVNPDAPLEYEQTLERFDFLTQQIEDLTRTEKRLRRVIAELDDLTSRAFAETVDKVDGIFSELFERLFGGGSAQLVLTEPDDLTISGVDIICRLPNRRQQRLGLLSGGERSLTATALIFALLKVAPPPFCVMDEVDAMLDEANVNRFRSVLRDLSQHSQFIVITHNRGTVQAARTVYGISMGTDSASQVISIRPEEYVNGNEQE
ncbi:MAG TPA: chromosome segregation protein SMC, partial [Candidatus Binatia bacterium]|nr:chromosome segregation protein SMC [Candidatus Binatia bacterium]